MTYLEFSDRTFDWEAECDCPECAVAVEKGESPICHTHPTETPTFVEGGYLSGAKTICDVCGATLAREYRIDDPRDES